MNAIDFLKKEHELMRKRLVDISEHARFDEAKRKMFDHLCQILIRHETMEHQVWYPHFKNKLSKTVQHLVTEEKHAEKAIKQFEVLKTQQSWEEKFAKFKQDVEHHAEEEEEKLFPEVKKLLSEKKLEEIGEEMSLFKRNNPTSETKH